MEDRDERSRGMEIRIPDALAKIKTTEPLFRHIFFPPFFFLSYFLTWETLLLRQVSMHSLKKKKILKKFARPNFVTSTFRKSKNSFCRLIRKLV